MLSLYENNFIYTLSLTINRYGLKRADVVFCVGYFFEIQTNVFAKNTDIQSKSFKRRPFLNSQDQHLTRRRR